MKVSVSMPADSVVSRVCINLAATSQQDGKILLGKGGADQPTAREADTPNIVAKSSGSKC